jgi:hypothetical protein
MPISGEPCARPAGHNGGHRSLKSVKYHREYDREHKVTRYANDPEFAERQRERQREYAKDPEFAERKRQRERERYAIRKLQDEG